MKLASKIGYLCLLITSSNLVLAQSNWEKQPKIHALDAAYNKESLVLILDDRSINYEHDAAKKDYAIRRVTHRIFKLVDEKGVESLNKQIIPTGYDVTITEKKFRLIKTNGKVIEVADKDIKSSTDENGLLQYHVAYEDAGVGDEIEYYLVEKESFKPFGGEYLQFSIPVLQSNLTISAPTDISLKTKSYNDYPTLTIDTVDNIVYHKASQKNIATIEEEKYAYPRLYYKKVNYKVNAAASMGYIPLFTWNDLAKQRHNFLYNITDKEKKSVQKYLASLKINEDLSVEEKIALLEDGIKNNILLNDELEDPKYNELDYLLDKKTTFKQGYLKLFVNCLELLGIKHEAGMGNDKYETTLDEQFENWNNLSDYYIYINNSKQYILPIEITLRYPSLTPESEGAKGVFIKRLSANNVTTATANFRTLPTTSYKHNNHDLDIKVDLNNSFQPVVNINHIFTGLSANGLREIATYITKENEVKFVNSLIDFINEEDEIKKYSFTNKGVEHYRDNKPLIINAVVNAPNLVETAGNKYLFKIGNLIGRQEELYQEKQRQLPIIMPYPHGLKRTIKIEIPEGYKVVNPEILQKKLGAAEKYGFESSYQLNNNTLVVELYEYYAASEYAPEEYEKFRAVINAAADFNKLTLIIDKI